MKNLRSDFKETRYLRKSEFSDKEMTFNDL